MNVLKYYGQLLKFRLSITVVFSAMVGYLLGIENFVFNEFIFLIVGGFFVTGSANGFNQILEKDKDKLMERTADRPLPQGNLSVLQAVIFCSYNGIIRFISFKLYKASRKFLWIYVQIFFIWVSFYPALCPFVHSFKESFNYFYFCGRYSWRYPIFIGLGSCY